MAYAAVPGPPAARARPTVEIVEQPVDEYRFRYELECRTNGSIPGEHSTSDNKTYPTIMVNNYEGPVKIQVSCVANDYRPHPHKLVGREGCRHGVCTIRTKITDENRTWSFKNLGIQCVKRRDVEAVLQDRELLRIDPFRTGFDPSTYRSLDLHHVRLAFQVFLPDAAGHCRVPLRAVASRPIADFKNRLHVVQASQCEGIATGGTQVMLLTEKLPRDVSVVFCDEGSDWQAEATIERIHRQFALVMKTPPYRDPNITHPVDVVYYLTVANKRSISNICQFVYIPKISEIELKRQKSPERLLQLVAEITETASNYIVSQNAPGCSLPFHEIPPEPSFAHQEQNWIFDPNVASASHHAPPSVQPRRQQAPPSFTSQQNHEPPYHHIGQSPDHCHAIDVDAAYRGLQAPLHHSPGVPEGELGYTSPMTPDPPKYFFLQNYHQVLLQQEMELESAALAMLQHAGPQPQPTCQQQLDNMLSEEDMLSDILVNLTTSGDRLSSPT